MRKRKICFIAQFPPPIHGLSKAVDTLYNSKIKEEFDLEKVDITNNKEFVKNLRIISKSKADLFYFTISQSQVGNLRDLIILKLLWRQQKKCLLHLHGGYYRQLVDHDLCILQRKANYEAIKRLSGVIVLTNSLKKNFYGMIPEEKIFVVQNCVDDEYLMSDDEFEEKLSRVKKYSFRHILYLSNFIPSKGYLEVLELAKIEKIRIETGGKKKFHFEFAGEFYDEAEKKQFDSFIRNNDLEDYITYHGVVTGKKKQELLMLCDIFALFTRYPKEGQPISILEAMGNGMIVTTTNHAGIPDMIEDGVNGIVMDKELLDMRQCYQKILNKSSEEIQKIMNQNRKMIKDFYNQNTFVENMSKVFAQI